ncbi:MAG TPA: bifunctional 3-deoxy-7-phosphoheptulonate synthase/chorismate mutase [Ignavibacteriales bacterium]|nr:bifunctional 3-deoxy-7-phosphoheptulonate synthase/chorismate mutase [Ignavibacteriales bacterium]
MQDKNKIREKINQIDEQLLSLLAERRSLSQEIVKVKNLEGAQVRDKKREEELLFRLIKKGKELGIDSYFITQIFNEIIEDSLRIQQYYLQQTANPELDDLEIIRIAIQGVEGSYSHKASKKFFIHNDARLSFLSKSTFKDVVTAVEEGQVDYGVLPIENTTSGSINEVYDVLSHAQISIVGEVKVKVEHCLIAIEDIPLNKIEKIYSHPQAIMQCSNFLQSFPDVKIEYYEDTALAVHKIKNENNKNYAAIASEEAAQIYEMTILRKNIANQSENYTRFLVIARNAQKVDLRIPCKTSLVLATEQKPGALVDALSIFKEHNLNMTKIQSRPIIGNPWEELFYIDFEGNMDDPDVATAIDELRKVTRFLKILGSYPAYDIERLVTVPVNIDTETKEIKSEPKVELRENKEKPKTPSGYKLASRAYKPENTVVTVKNIKIGDGNFVVMAGPCAVESYDQIMVTAKEVKEYGGVILRGGCFKPRTSPYSFQGLGFEGLKMMKEAGNTFGMPIVTEVLAPEDVEPIIRGGCDMLQIGARNMANFALLKEVGKTNVPVLLKRGMMSSIEELLQAAEYILAQGNQQVVLCERGIRTFETATRNTLDIAAVPILKELTHLPVIVDPSHSAKHRNLVVPLAKAAKAVGADGIIVEIHPEPEKALSDGPQALTFDMYENLMKDLLNI